MRHPNRRNPIFCHCSVPAQCWLMAAFQDQPMYRRPFRTRPVPSYKVLPYFLIVETCVYISCVVNTPVTLFGYVMSWHLSLSYKCCSSYSRWLIVHCHKAFLVQEIKPLKGEHLNTWLTMHYIPVLCKHPFHMCSLLYLRKCEQRVATEMWLKHVRQAWHVLAFRICYRL